MKKICVQENMCFDVFACMQTYEQDTCFLVLSRA